MALADELDDALHELRTASEAEAGGRIDRFVGLVASGLDLCISRLVDRAYVFQGEVTAPLTDDDRAKLERHGNEMPPLLLALWERIGTVDLRGTLPEPPYTSNGFDPWRPRIDPESLAQPRNAPKVYYADQLEIAGPREALRDYLHERRGDGARYIDIAPDACVKAGYGGGNPTSVVVPASGHDPLVDSPEWDSGTTLGELLVVSLRWGGLPGLRRYPRDIAIAILGENVPT